MKLNNKNKLLVFSFFTALIICYMLSFSNTIEYYNLYSEQLKQLNSKNNSPNHYAQLLNKEKKYNAILAEYSLDNSLYQNELLKHLSSQCEKHHLKIIEFDQPHIHKNGSTVTTSYKFTLEGNFTGTLKLLNSIENKHILGTIKHVSTLKKIDYKTNNNYLNTIVIIQRIDNEN